MRNDCLKLKEIIKLELKNVRLYHSEFDGESTGIIPELNINQFSEFGKAFWNEALEAKVDKFTGKELYISDIGIGMFREFRDMMLGENEGEMYDKCIVDKQTLVAEQNENPDMGYKKEFAMLTAVYENLSGTPNEERCTAYFSNFGEYLFRQNQNMDKVKAVVGKALKSLNMSMDEFVDKAKSMTCQSIRLKMREDMMAQKIAVGDTILFVSEKPEYAPDTFEFIGAKVTSIDEEQKKCHVKADYLSTDVSFRYIIGKHNMEVDYEIFGNENCELLLGANINDAQMLLAESMTHYYEQDNEVDEKKEIDMQGV